MKGRVRVLRVIEYIYDDHSKAIQDMSNWNLGANEAKVLPGMELRSAVVGGLLCYQAIDEKVLDA